MVWGRNGYRMTEVGFQNQIFFFEKKRKKKKRRILKAKRPFPRRKGPGKPSLAYHYSKSS
jgi:hypothetical protein